MSSTIRWPPLSYFLPSFVLGIGFLFVLGLIITEVIRCLKRTGGIPNTFERSGLDLSVHIGRIEQFLFFMVSMAGAEVFGWAAGGWFVFKGLQRWAQWNTNGGPQRYAPYSQDTIVRAKDLGVNPHEVKDQIDRNRFLIFVVGTGMSIAAGGIAGTVTLYTLALMESSCGEAYLHCGLQKYLFAITAIVIVATALVNRYYIGWRTRQE